MRQGFCLVLLCTAELLPYSAEAFTGDRISQPRFSPFDTHDDSSCTSGRRRKAHTIQLDTISATRSRLSASLSESQFSLPANSLSSSESVNLKVSKTPLVEEHVPTTFREALEVFLLGSYNGPRIVVGLLLTIAAWRISLPENLASTDAAVVAGMTVFWCFQEHFLHGKVLHSEIDWYGKEIHQGHHARPYHHVSIDPAWLMLTWMGVVGVFFYLVLPLRLALSAMLGYAMSGLWYEFLHFIVHTRVRFRKGSYLQRMKDHHARHHLIDHRYWLGFSLPAVDELFGTNPTVTQVRTQKKTSSE